MALNLARSGAKLLAAVSLHGEYPHLDKKVGTNGATGTYNTQHFVEMVGHNDPFIPEEARDAWVAELQARVANTDNTFDFIVYGSSVHAFSIHYSKTFLDVSLRERATTTKPNQTKPNETKPNQTKPNQNKTKQNAARPHV